MSHASAPTDHWQVDRPHPIVPGESYNGYVLRVAAAEGHPTTFDLHRIAGLELPRRTELGPTCVDGVPDLARTLRIDPQELLTRTHAVLPDKGRSWRGMTLDRYALELGTRRFSPASLARSDHHRALWCLRSLPFCDESWEHLVDRCPSPHCGVVQRWYYPAGVSLCDRCGEPLVGAATTEVDPALRDRLRLAIGLLHHDPSRVAESRAALPDRIRALPPGGAFHMLTALARVAQPALPSRRRAIDAGIDPTVLAAAMAAAWTLLTDWPASFDRLATSRLAERGGRHGDGNGGRTLGFLLRDWHVGAPGVTPLVAELRARYEDNARTCPDVGTVLRGSGTKARDLAKVRRQGLVETVFALDGNRAMPLVSVGSAKRLANARRGSRLPEEVATVLGLPIYGVEQACSLGVLQWMKDPLPCAVRAGVRVASASLDGLAAGLASAAVDALDDGRLLDRVLLGIGGRLKPWGPLLQRMLDRSIRFDLGGRSAEAPLLSRVRIDRSDVATVRALAWSAPTASGAFPFRTSLTRAEACEILNVKATMGATALAAWPAPRSGRPVVPVIELERIAAAQVSPTEIAEIMCLKTFGARRILERAGVAATAIGFERAAAYGLISEALAPGGAEALSRRLGERRSAVARLLRRVEVRYRPRGRLGQASLSLRTPMRRT